MSHPLGKCERGIRKEQGLTVETDATSPSFIKGQRGKEQFGYKAFSQRKSESRICKEQLKPFETDATSPVVEE